MAESVALSNCFLFLQRPASCQGLAGRSGRQGAAWAGSQPVIQDSRGLVTREASTLPWLIAVGVATVLLAARRSRSKRISSADAAAARQRLINANLDLEVPQKKAAKKAPQAEPPAAATPPPTTATAPPAAAPPAPATQQPAPATPPPATPPPAAPMPPPAATSPPPATPVATQPETPPVAQPPTPAATPPPATPPPASPPPAATSTPAAAAPAPPTAAPPLIDAEIVSPPPTPGQSVAAAPPSQEAPPTSAAGASSSSSEVPEVPGDFALPDGRAVRTFANEAGAATALVADVVAAAKAAIAEKGAFSLAVSGGSVASALKDLKKAADGVDFSKFYVFFCSDDFTSFPTFEANRPWLEACGVPADQIFKVDDLPAEAAAATYTSKICMQEENVVADSPDGLPAVDLMLLDAAADGSVAGGLLPGSEEAKDADSGQVVLFSDGSSRLTVSPDFMNASGKAIVFACSPDSGSMVSTALQLEKGNLDCPASMIRAQSTTKWLVTAANLAEYNSSIIQ
eukprot:TRINITY_DN65267_c0_g1_i1.p1 TRINITY_DN65267_c0_g1~~TRINITY_DN65267_c0_g1_i1.p1  ORF type:complete len:535 (+),score=137.13 TRINITY_DN65267_c0_g1_i1:62-1606(+)